MPCRRLAVVCFDQRQPCATADRTAEQLPSVGASGADGKFEMDNVSDEVRSVLKAIEEEQARASRAAQALPLLCSRR